MDPQSFNQLVQMEAVLWLKGGFWYHEWLPCEPNGNGFREGVGCGKAKMKIGGKIPAMRTRKGDRLIYHDLQRQKDFLEKNVKQHNMTNKTITIHVFIDQTKSTNNVKDNSPKRWHMFCINSNTYCITFERTRKVSFSLIWSIHTYVINKPETWKITRFSCFLVSYFSYFSVMTCNA